MLGEGQAEARFQSTVGRRKHKARRGAGKNEAGEAGKAVSTWRRKMMLCVVRRGDAAVGLVSGGRHERRAEQ